MLNYCKIPLDFLKFSGNDRLDLVNRLSSNKVDNLKKHGGIKTVLTSDKGRFIDLLTLYNFGDFVFAVCSFNNSKPVIAHLDKYTIMDDFKVIDMAGTHEAVLFYGGNADKFAEEIFNIDISKFSNNDFGIFGEEDRHSIIARNDDGFGGFYFIYSIKDSEHYQKMLFNDELIKKFTFNKIPEEVYEFERIKLGIPNFGREMTDETNPLECGLNRYVSFTKGCYIGQEVIARLDTYDKISKHMVKLEISGELHRDLNPGEAKISIDNKDCGYVTSYSDSGDKTYIGLGFVKTAFLDFEKTYKIKLKDIITDCRLVKIN